MKREELVDYLDGLLMPGKFRDYCPNGLQVEGRADVVSIVTGVTASAALIEAAQTAASRAARRSNSTRIAASPRVMVILSKCPIIRSRGNWRRTAASMPPAVSRLPTGGSRS